MRHFALSACLTPFTRPPPPTSAVLLTEHNRPQSSDGVSLSRLHFPLSLVPFITKSSLCRISTLESLVRARGPAMTWMRWARTSSRTAARWCLSPAPPSPRPAARCSPSTLSPNSRQARGVRVSLRPPPPPLPTLRHSSPQSVSRPRHLLPTTSSPPPRPPLLPLLLNNYS